MGEKTFKVKVSIVPHNVKVAMTWTSDISISDGMFKSILTVDLTSRFMTYDGNGV